MSTILEGCGAHLKKTPSLTLCRLRWREGVRGSMEGRGGLESRGKQCEEGKVCKESKWRERGRDARRQDVVCACVL